MKLFGEAAQNSRESTAMRRRRSVAAILCALACATLSMASASAEPNKAPLASAERILDDQGGNVSLIAGQIKTYGRSARIASFQKSAVSAGLAKTLLSSSMVKWSRDRKFVVMYNIYSDIFIVEDLRQPKAIVAIISGDTMHGFVSRDLVKQESNLVERLFHQRPQLLDAIVQMIDLDSKFVESFLLDKQRSAAEAAAVLRGIAFAALSMDSARKGPCLKEVEKQFATFAAEDRHLRLNTLWKLSDGDYYIFQDDETGRNFVAMALSEPPLCDIKTKRSIIAY